MRVRARVRVRVRIRVGARVRVRTGVGVWVRVRAGVKARARVTVVGVLDAQGDVGLELLAQAVADVARGEQLAHAAGEGRLVHAEGDRHGRLLHLVRVRVRG